MRATNQIARPNTALNIIAAFVVIAALYFGKAVLVPVALAVLVSFLLSPIASRIERVGLGRIPSVMIVVSLALCIVGIITWVIANQVTDLAHQIPAYRGNIDAKLAAIRGPIGEMVGKASAAAHELGQGLSVPTTQPAEVRVEPVPPPPGATEVIRNTLSPIFERLATAFIVLILVVFMLLQREDLRERFIHVIGRGHLTVTTQALDDAAARVSRYLLMQSIINGTYGLAIGIGLFFIGIPNAALWGLLAGVLRFLPYVGPWLGAAVPITLSLAAFDDWRHPTLAIGLFVGLEILTNSVMEPWLYGTNTGVSPIAILLAAVFWASLWGGVGLLLATPLTVCLVVMGKYLPPFEFLTILLGDQPVLKPHEQLYQRLLSMDGDDVTDFIDKELRENDRSLAGLYDDLVLPALRLAELDRHRGNLDPQRRSFIEGTVRDIVEDIGEVRAETDRAADDETPGHGPEPICIVCLPALDEADELAALMFAQALDLPGCRVEAVPLGVLAAEKIDVVQQRRASVVCISAMPPAGATHARYLCKRLLARFPDMQVVIGLWQSNGSRNKLEARVRCGPGVQIATSFADARARILQVLETVRIRTAAEASHPGNLLLARQ